MSEVIIRKPLKVKPLIEDTITRVLPRNNDSLNEITYRNAKINKKYKDKVVLEELSSEIAKIIIKPYDSSKTLPLVSYQLNGLYIILFNTGNFVALSNVGGKIINDNDKLREMTKQAFEDGYFQINGFDNTTIDFIGRVIYGKEIYDKIKKVLR